MWSARPPTPNLPDPRSQPEPRRFERGWEWGTGRAASGWVSVVSRLARAPFIPLRSQKKDLPPTTQDYQARFYEIYREEAKDHDKEFTKKYDGDLNTTLIFVSLLLRLDTRVLTRVAGRSVLRRDFRLHHRNQLRAQARPE